MDKKYEMIDVSDNGDKEIGLKAVDVTIDGEKIGHMDMFFNEEGDEVYVKSIEVTPEKRNQGWGTQILRDLSCKYWKLYICAENPDAKRLYQRIGEEVDCPPEWLSAEYDNWGNMYCI